MRLAHVWTGLERGKIEDEYHIDATAIADYKDISWLPERGIDEIIYSNCLNQEKYGRRTSDGIAKSGDATKLHWKKTWRFD